MVHPAPGFSALWRRGHLNLRMSEFGAYAEKTELPLVLQRSVNADAQDGLFFDAPQTTYPGFEADEGLIQNTLVEIRYHTKFCDMLCKLRIL
jgi:hypothetical protein